MIEVRDICKSYRGRLAVQDISFSVAKGEVLGFLGPNGAGKSTTMRILSGILRANSGIAKVNGFDVAKDSVAAKAVIGFLPETPPVYPSMEVNDYIHFVASIHHVPSVHKKKMVESAMEKCGLSAVRKRIIGNLSKGFRQRVGIAQAIVHNPPVLILDEPTVGLDPMQIIEIRNLIRSFAGDHTIILSTHILSEVQATCDRVVVIDKGKVLANDTIAGISARSHSGYQIFIRTRKINDGTLEKMRKIYGVEAVVWEKLENSTNECFKIRVTCKVDSDLCSHLAELCVVEKLGLLELREEQISLEDAFMRLLS